MRRTWNGSGGFISASGDERFNGRADGRRASMILRAVIVGCGWIGSRFNEGPRKRGSVYAHAAAYRHAKGVRLVAVADIDPARREQCRKAWGVPSAYADYREMLRREAPDLVSICTPDETHYEVARAALAAPSVRGILCEKPLATQVEEAAAIVRRAATRGVRLAVNYIRRYDRGHQQAARLIKEGVLGRIEKGRGVYSGGILHNGSHLLDLLLWFLGPIEEIVSLPETKQVGPDPGVDAWLRFRSGASVMIQACSARNYPVFELDLLGANGRLEIRRAGERFHWFGVKSQPASFDRRVLVPMRHSSSSRLRDLTLAAVRDLVTAVRDNRALLCDGRTAVACLTVGHRVIESMRIGEARHAGLSSE